MQGRAIAERPIAQSALVRIATRRKMREIHIVEDEQVLLVFPLLPKRDRREDFEGLNINEAVLTGLPHR